MDRGAVRDQLAGCARRKRAPAGLFLFPRTCILGRVCVGESTVLNQPWYAWEYECCMYVLRTTRGYFDIHTCSVSSACISDIAQGRESVLETARSRDSRQPNNGSVLDRNVRVVKVYTDSNAVSPQRTQEIIRTQNEVTAL